jgi:3-oxoacyl-[acyl-carrier-protein] synthase III
MKFSEKRTLLKGIGGYLPENCFSNVRLASEKNLDTSDEWISERTGIKTRYFASDNEFSSDLATKAALSALKNSNLSPDDIDMVIVATTTPDLTFPSVATIVQKKLGMRQGFAFDVSAVCSGFIYAMTVADSFIQSGKVQRVLVIGAETMSRILDWSDRSTCVLFGDGAGAVVLEASSKENAETEQSAGIVSSCLKSDGALGNILYVDGGVGVTQTSGVLKMQGRDVFRHAVSNLFDISLEVLHQAKKSVSDIDWIIPHQANKRIMSAVAEKLNFSEENIISTVEYHGNTSAASVPLALFFALEKGYLKKGQWLLLSAIGGGMTWGAILLQY